MNEIEKYCLEDIGETMMTVWFVDPRGQKQFNRLYAAKKNAKDCTDPEIKELVERTVTAYNIIPNARDVFKAVTEFRDLALQTHHRAIKLLTS